MAESAATTRGGRLTESAGCTCGRLTEATGLLSLGLLAVARLLRLLSVPRLLLAVPGLLGLLAVALLRLTLLGLAVSRLLTLLGLPVSRLLRLTESTLLLPVTRLLPLRLLRLAVSLLGLPITGLLRLTVPLLPRLLGLSVTLLRLAISRLAALGLTEAARLSTTVPGRTAVSAATCSTDHGHRPFATRDTGATGGTIPRSAPKIKHVAVTRG